MYHFSKTATQTWSTQVRHIGNPKMETWFFKTSSAASIRYCLSPHAVLAQLLNLRIGFLRSYFWLCMVRWHPLTIILLQMVGAHEFGAKRFLKFSTQMEHQYPERLGWQGKQNNGSHATLIILRLLPQADFAKPTTATRHYWFENKAKDSGQQFQFKDNLQNEISKLGRNKMMSFQDYCKMMSFTANTR